MSAPSTFEPATETGTAERTAELEKQEALALENQPEEPSQAIKEVSAVPPEIFLEVCPYFDPRSRALANLAATCRDLHELLLPCLVRKVTGSMICRESFLSFLDQKKHVVEKHVKELEVFEGSSYDHNKLLRASRTKDAIDQILQLCKDGLKYLRMDMHFWPHGQSLYDAVDLVLPNVRELELRDFEDITFEALAKLCPNMEVLALQTTCYSNQTKSDNIWSVTELQDMWQDIESRLINFRELRWDFPPGEIKHLNEIPSLLAKIMSFTSRDSRFLMMLCETPSFKPTTLVIEDDLLLGDWNTIGRLSSLKHLKIREFNTYSLSEWPEFPPQLESFEVSNYDCDDVFYFASDSSHLLPIPTSLKQVSLTYYRTAISPRYESDFWGKLVKDLSFWVSLEPKQGAKVFIEVVDEEDPESDYSSTLLEAVRNSTWWSEDGSKTEK